jgi:hypothetical protein
MSIGFIISQLIPNGNKAEGLIRKVEEKKKNERVNHYTIKEYGGVKVSLNIFLV